MSARIPPNEAARLEALRQYAVLDSEAEQGFDGLVRVASMLCGTPISLISLVDADRQWFKARHGLDATETPREQAFCAHAILDDTPLVVPDALRDQRFEHNPLVTGDPGIRFYAGAPLITQDGHALGTLCVIDRQPRALDTTQLEGLQLLARQVVTQLEHRRVAAALAEALAGVKTLQGLIPICAWCKLLRDDDGYWQSVETYLEQQAGVAMTHGMCPGCHARQTEAIRSARD